MFEKVEREESWKKLADTNCTADRLHSKRIPRQHAHVGPSWGPRGLAQLARHGPTWACHVGTHWAGQRFPSLSPRGPTLAMHGPTWGHAWPFMARPWPCHGHAWACPAGLGVREGVLFNSIKNFLRLFRRCLIKLILTLLYFDFSSFLAVNLQNWELKRPVQMHWSYTRCNIDKTA